MKIKFFSWLAIAWLVCWLGMAAPAAETLTKGEVIQMLSTTEFMKKKIGELFSWTVGYDITKVNRVSLTPTINYVRAIPRKVPPDGRTVLELLASVDDPGGLANIAGVRADLSNIGRLANTMLVDNGVFGDKKSGDGIFTLQTSVATKVEIGSKDIPVAVANKKGWLALAKTSLEIRKNPFIVDARFQPERALADGKTLVTIAVKVENPGRIEDVENVTADMRQLRLDEGVKLLNSGFTGNDTWSFQFILSKDAPAGTYQIPVKATNLIGGRAVGSATLTVYK